MNQIQGFNHQKTIKSHLKSVSSTAKIKQDDGKIYLYDKCMIFMSQDFIVLNCNFKDLVVFAVNKLGKEKEFTEVNPTVMI